ETHRVAGTKPTPVVKIDERIGHRFGPVPIAVANVRSADEEPADLARPNALDRSRLDDRHFNARHRHADATHDARSLVPVAERKSEFGRTVALENRNAELFLELAMHVGRQCG